MTLQMPTDECHLCGGTNDPHSGSCGGCGLFYGTAIRESAFDERVEMDPSLERELDDFALAYLRGVELRGAFLSGADLFGINLAAADLRSTDLGSATLVDADLRGADLRGANLAGADLSGARLDGAELEGAIYNRFTSWPEGFDPHAAGAISFADRRKGRLAARAQSGHREGQE